MTFSSFTLVMVSAFLFALVGIVFVRKTHKKTLLNRQLRKQLLYRIENLPLPNMLQALGINFRKYFYQVPFENIRESVQICETCPSTSLCENLPNQEKSAVDVDFCPNLKRLNEYQQN